MPYRIDYQKGNKNAKGEPAPWVIINGDREEIGRKFGIERDGGVQHPCPVGR
jgi:hypothetical protein